MNDADKANVVAFYVEIDTYVDVPEKLVDPSDTIVSYIDTSSDEDEEEGNT